MTPAAKGDLSVGGMAVRTSDSRMFSHVLLQLAVDVIMATGANRRRCFLSIRNLSRFVNRVAAHTGLGIEFNCRTVRFMTDIALRNMPVFVRMTIRACHIGGVLARKIFNFAGLWGMTKRARRLYVSHGNVQGRVGIGVASETRDQPCIRSVKGSAAGAQVTC